MDLKVRNLSKMVEGKKNPKPETGADCQKRGGQKRVPGGLLVQGAGLGSAAGTGSLAGSAAGPQREGLGGKWSRRGGTGLGRR